MFRRYLSREIDQWTRSGLLPPGQGEILLADHDRRHTGFSLSGVLAVLAAVLFGAAVIALIAANWEFIPRLMRVVTIFVFIICGLSVASLALKRGSGGLSEAALVFTLLCYGAGIALVGQMYHLSGDEAAFMLTWAVGALVVSLCFSSAMAAVSAGLLGFGYMFAEASFFDSRSDVHLTGYLIVLALAFAVGLSAWRSRSAIAGHLAALLLICWAMWIIKETTDLEPGYPLAVMGAVVFGIGSFAPGLLGSAISRHGAVSSYGAVMLLSGLGLIQVTLVNPGLALEMALAAFILLISVAVLAVAGGENRLVRRFAYFAFACETIYVVSETLGSLLGSSGFLFLGGIALAVIAFAVMKIEKRFKNREVLP
ncbi:MAG: DUF2157 domain-containing protein [Hoeflea sp.]|uniref:DUF2157 domain-containing protein n=1 Tax=Hoeflea sp. TaxID=1940281 RepID=UPI001E058F2B|nr:DUF2157 domain-containing protein [Hoeflea sp.]MBU4530693.1 DUF2157 domain-containing protein [Alphaproteobacteria bacterium]MBU4544913.1 DUF2157 domain-containing protein [Alphaproteobacteria bacterium]MBU4552056.1 DUF2157 domain-containing protein [Alphaproteobacteria bacterium]MBV1722245.1 DUF2157 domain-containing protein [Hoeflea sp.]MBV1761807.1 DUF2157 domain-containing protein [Hoeflea sp.]